jgi:hypothetical protein
MEREYRQVIQNIKLTKEEAQTLYNARKILLEARNCIPEFGYEYDKDLLDAINKGIDGLDVCNPRLNVNIITRN